MSAYWKSKTRQLRTKAFWNTHTESMQANEYIYINMKKNNNNDDVDDGNAWFFSSFLVYSLYEHEADRLNVCSFISFRCVMRAHNVRFVIAFHFILFGICCFFPFHCKLVSASFGSSFFSIYFIFYCPYVRAMWWCAWVRPVQQVFNRDRTMENH